MTSERAHRIVYVGCGLAGKATSLLSVLARSGQSVPNPAAVLVGEHRFRFTRGSGETVVLDLSISGRRAVRSGYDPTSPDCDPVIVEEMDRIASAEGLIFVIDSQSSRQMSNEHHFEMLVRDLASRGVDARSKPIVFQANKRDAADAVTMDWVRTAFSAESCAYIESVATNATGTLEALREVLKMAGSID